MTVKRRASGVAADITGRKTRSAGTATTITKLWKRTGGTAVTVHDWTGGGTPPPTGSIAFVAGAASTPGFAATSAVPAIASTQAGDILIACAAGNSQSDTITPPAGLTWTALASTNIIGGGRFHLLTATATGALGAGTWTWPGSHNHAVGIVAYRGAKAPTTASVAAVVLNTATTSAPSQTTVAANAVLVAAGYHASGGTTRGFVGSMTARVDTNTATPGMVIAEEARATPGATGTRAYTVSPGNTTLFAGSLALEPA